MNGGRKIRILIVDDSAVVRKLLAGALSGEPDLEVAGSAPDPYIARDKILALRPDVLTLDIEMPRMDGLTFLKKIMQFQPMPVIVISSLAQASCRAGIEALGAGAVDIMAKPGGPYSAGEWKATLVHKIRAAAAARIARADEPRAPAVEPRACHSPAAIGPEGAGSLDVIAIGASTGGTEAIEAVLTRLPSHCPGIVIAQHIPAGFSRAFAERLNRFCPMRVAEAEDGAIVQPGLALIAPGNFHMTLEKDGGRYRVRVKDGPTVCYQRPSVDVLFSSVAEAAGRRAVGAILTGMGADGAQGIHKMRLAGAVTIAQEESTCVVFGMPKEAIRVGGVERIVKLPRIAAAIRGAFQVVDRD